MDMICTNLVLKKYIHSIAIAIILLLNFQKYKLIIKRGEIIVPMSS